MLAVLLSALLTHALVAYGQEAVQDWTTSPFPPHSLPLAVRSPYLSFWLPQGTEKFAAPEADNEHWYGHGDTVPGLYVSAVVDNSEYRLLGQYYDGEGKPTQTSVEFTATRTSFVMTAGQVQFNLSFLSPIEATNFTLLSLPFSYLVMTAESIDGNPHRVQMYSDVEGGAVAGKRTEIIQWQVEDDGDDSQYIVLSMRLQNQEQFVEEIFVSKDLTVYYGFKKITGTTASWSIDNIDHTRGVYVGNPVGGMLNNEADPNFRVENNGSNTAVLGIGVDWGNITSTPEPAVWCLGLVGDPSIRYRTPDNLDQARRPYFLSDFYNAVEAAKFFLDHFQRAQSAAQSLDYQLMGAGEVISPEYTALLSLSARQAMGSMDITLPPPVDGEWDKTNIRVFMKNMGSSGYDAYNTGDTMSVNSVGTLYAAFPAFLYFNPDILAYLLEPLLEFQHSSFYSLPYAATDMGSSYPSAIADTINNRHNFGIDTTSSMIIMSLAYSLSSGNGTLLREHYPLFRRWADYLVNNSFSATEQSSSDFSLNSDFTSDNQANLILKGVIGISAMAKIAEVTGNETDQIKFNNSANSATESWQTGALSNSYINFILNDSSTSAIAYNLYADKLLRLNLVPQEVYELSTQYIQKTIGDNSFGIPLTSTPGQNTTTNGLMFAAASLTDSVTQKQLISQVHAYASNTLNNQPLSPYYDPSTGSTFGDEKISSVGLGRNSPAQGSIFALLALNATNQTIRSAGAGKSSSGEGDTGTRMAPGVIAGIAIGGFLGLCGLVFTVFYCVRRYLRKRDQANPDFVVEPFTPPDMREQRRFAPYPSKSNRNQPSTTNDVPTETSKQRQTHGSAEKRSNMMRQASLEAQQGQSSENTGEGPSGRDRKKRTRTDRNTDTRREQVWAPLREEVSSLRREVEQLRRERESPSENPEALPSYSDTRQ